MGFLAPGRFLFIVYVGIVAACAASTAVSLAIVGHSYQTVLFSDQWTASDIFELYLHGTLTWGDLIAQHNEHRILIPRLVFLLDLIWADGRNTVNYAVILLVQAAHAILLCSLVWRYVGHYPLRWALSGLVVLLLFCVNQWENLICGFQIQFVGVFFLATVAGYALSTAQEMRASLVASSLAAAGLLCGVGAVLMMANGALALASIAFVFLVTGLLNRLTLAVAVAAAAVLGVFALTFTPTPLHTSFGYSATHPVAWMQHSFIYVGSIFAAANLTFATIAGFCALALAALALAGLATGRVARNRATLTLSVVMVFVAASAVLTGMGRSSFGVHQAASGRYVTPSALMWASIAAFAVVHFGGTASRSRVFGPIGVAGMLAIMTALLLWPITRAQQHAMRELPERAASLEQGTNALLVFADDDAALEKIYPTVSMLPERVARLADRRLSIFAEVAQWPYGATLQDRQFADGKQKCRGGLDPPQFVSGTANNSLLVGGWSRDPGSDRPFQKIVMLSDEQKVVGYGSLIPQPLGLRTLLRIADSKAGRWSGYLRMDRSSRVTAHGVLADGKLCPLASTEVMYAKLIHRQVVDLEMTPRLSALSVAPRIEGHWSIDGQHPVAGRPPGALTVYGSWSGADSHNGVLSYQNVVLRSSTLNLVFVTGPVTDGIAIEFRTERGETQVFRPPFLSRWAMMKFRLPPDFIGQPITVRVVDDGAGWGQWIAVGGMFEEQN